ncbi:MAG: plasmid stabilization protein [Moraxellaceae bacterium]|nr:MAG: plasmid stabilization protein [Moraxellaceae bacterium]
MTRPSDKNYRVTRRARDDLKQIGRYTQQTWGKAQRTTYLKAIEKRFQWLAGNPLLGQHRADIGEGYYSFPQGQHVVFYLIGDGLIEIIGVLHKEMDIIHYFQEK